MTSVLVAPTEAGSGSTTISFGLLHALDAQGVKVGFLKPVAQSYSGQEPSSHLARTVLHKKTPEPMQFANVQQRIAQGLLDSVLEDVVAMHAQVARLADVVIIEGLSPDPAQPDVATLNAEIAKALNASVLLVANAQGRNVDQIRRELTVHKGHLGHAKDNLLGLILNKVGSAADRSGLRSAPGSLTADQGDSFCTEDECQQLGDAGCPVIGILPRHEDLASPRMLDVARALNAELVREGDLASRRVRRIAVCAQTVPNMLETLQPGSLIVAPGDRHDILFATGIAAATGTVLAGLLLTDGLIPDPGVVEFCQPALQTGIPVLRTQMDMFDTAEQLTRMDTDLPADDVDRLTRSMDFVAERLDADLLLERLNAPHSQRLSPAAFRYQLVQRAQSDRQRIVLPEGNDARTIQAAAICQERGIADCVLISPRKDVEEIAASQGITLPETLKIVDPTGVRGNYVQPMVRLRAHKRLPEAMVVAELEDNVVLGTMMLAEDHVDGLVSGAVHTTANTIRPALQLIRTAPGARLVSSVFFMGLPDQVLVFGDCAVNPTPDAEELADIAIQSAQSALAMGIEPRVAMISYSTGASGSGADVDLVRQATARVRELQPELPVDGPLQYDAATTLAVAQSKAPDSAVAGRATVLVFPDLNTGNTTYKAVQRSANVISVGPMLQGLAKPVNDLSRGATIDDIVYTIALTSLQAQFRKQQG